MGKKVVTRIWVFFECVYVMCFVVVCLFYLFNKKRVRVLSAVASISARRQEYHVVVIHQSRALICDRAGDVLRLSWYEPDPSGDCRS